MKKLFTILSVSVLLMMLSASPSKAQFSDMRSTAGINVGASIISMLFKAIDYSDDPYWKASQIPTVQFCYDYRVLDKVSVGAAASFNRVGIDYFNTEIGNGVDGELKDFTFSLNRINLAARGIFYYNENETFEVYSGLRLGVNIWSMSMDSNDPDFDQGVNPFDIKQLNKTAAPGLQLILLGGNIFPVENIGINFEFAIGQPYFAALGVRYRF